MSLLDTIEQVAGHGFGGHAGAGDDVMARFNGPGVGDVSILMSQFQQHGLGKVTDLLPQAVNHLTPNGQVPQV